MPSLILDAPRTHTPQRGHNNLGLNGTGALHSPDGHFSPDDFRNWRPFSTPSEPFIRRRSKDHIDGDLQDVQEDETVDPAHPWHRARRTDSRSPCPALNVAANHGYLPRDGRGLTMWSIIKALRECYNVSWPLASVLTIGAFIILRLGGIGYDWINPKIDLEDLAAHNVLEHNASLTHRDFGETPDSPTRNGSRSPRSRSLSSSSATAVTNSIFTAFSILSLLTPSGLRSLPSLFIAYILSFIHPTPSSMTALDTPKSKLSQWSQTHPRAPISPSTPLIRALFADSASGSHLTLKDVARARTRRLDSCPARKTPRHLAQFADSEFCLTLAIFSPGDELKVELEVLREWLEDERLPRGWKPQKELGFLQNHQNTVRMQEMMKALRIYRDKRRTVRTVAYE